MSWELVGKKCGACGGSLPLSTGVGSRCPHCGVLFGGEKSEYSSGGGSGGGGGDDAAGCCGCLVILGICALIGTCVSQCNEEVTPPVPAPPAVSVEPAGFEDDAPEEPAASEEWGEAEEIETPSEDSGIPSEETDAEASEMYPESQPWQLEPESGFAREAEPEPVPVPESSAFRIWTDSSGQHQTEAQFVDYTDGKARLRKRDGNLIEVPAEQLSEPDQQWLKTQRGP